jgi:hypothetical protein
MKTGGFPLSFCDMCFSFPSCPLVTGIPARNNSMCLMRTILCSVPSASRIGSISILLLFADRGETESLGTVALSGSTVPAPDDRWAWNVGGMIIGRGKPKCSEKNQPQFHSAHHKSHMAYTGIGPKPSWCKADDRSHGAAFAAFNISYMFRHQVEIISVPITVIQNLLLTSTYQD